MYKRGMTLGSYVFSHTFFPYVFPIRFFPLNNGAPVAFTNFISDGKVQVSPYLAISL